MSRTYPFEHFDTGDPMLGVLGTFWHRYFGEKGPLRGHLRGSAFEDAQRYIDYLEAVACTSRHDCPILHEDLWRGYLINESQLIEDTANLITYDGTGVYKVTADVYGLPRAGQRYGVNLLDGIEDIGVLSNRILAPTVAWTSGSEFFVEDGALYFVSNPFDNPEFPVQNVLDDEGNVTDRQTFLWGFKTLQDYQYLHQHYGYLLNLQLDSSQSYKNLINAYWDAFTRGMSADDLETLLAGMVGVPVVLGTSETVEVIQESTAKLTIVTDQRAYTFSPAANALVEVGDTVVLGQVMVDTLVVYDLAGSDGVKAMLEDCVLLDDSVVVDIPSSSSSPSVYSVDSVIDPNCTGGYQQAVFGLNFGPSFLSGGYTGQLTFENKKVTLDYEGVEGNQAIVTFEVNGFPADVAAFWENVEARDNLASYLDRRTSSSNLPPEPRHLPTYVNPLQLVLENVMGNNLIVVRLRTVSFGEDSIGARALRPLRNVLPPHTTLLIIIEITADTDYYDLIDDLSETVAAHAATPLISDIYDTASDMSESVKVYNAIGNCV